MDDIDWISAHCGQVSITRKRPGEPIVGFVSGEFDGRRFNSRASGSEIRDVVRDLASDARDRLDGGPERRLVERLKGELEGVPAGRERWKMQERLKAAEEAVAAL